MATISSSRVTKTVKRHYESSPYPQRNPVDEKRRMITTTLDSLPAINHYCFAGKRDFTKSMRVLVAGGGTGDSTIYLAKQLLETNGKVIHVDMSEASLDIARRRAHYAGVEHSVEFHLLDLLELPSTDLGPFDYINCSSVLHHLADPDAGLAALRAVLKEDGAMGLMVHGQYGRTGIYHMRELMRAFNQDEHDPTNKVDNALAMMDCLPQTNWLRFNETSTKLADASDPAEVYDRFLHSRDRAYSVPQLYELLSAAGLNVAEFSRDDRLLYVPEAAFSGNVLRQIKTLSIPNQQAAAELFWGVIGKHMLWATPQINTRIDVFDLENIPRFDAWAERMDYRSTLLAFKDEAFTVEVNRPDGIKISMPLPLCSVVRRLLELVDDRRTLSEIFRQIHLDLKQSVSLQEIESRCHRAFNTLQRLDLVMMRHRSVPPVGY